MKNAVFAIAVTLAFAACTTPDWEPSENQMVTFVKPTSQPPLGVRKVKNGEVILEQTVRSVGAMRTPVQVTTSDVAIKIDAGQVLYEALNTKTPDKKAYCDPKIIRSILTYDLCLVDSDGDGLFETASAWETPLGNIIPGRYFYHNEKIPTPIKLNPAPEAEYPTATPHVSFVQGITGARLEVRAREFDGSLGVDAVDIVKADLPKVYDMKGARIRVISLVDGLLIAEVLSGFPDVPLRLHNANHHG